MQDNCAVEDVKTLRSSTRNTIALDSSSATTDTCKHGILTTSHLFIYCPMLRNISFLNSFFCLTAKVYQLRSDRQQAFNTFLKCQSI
ncbi:hypothetical protein BDQ12DRAFT_678031 [Crucibulum laeve]|uniref:Uncharacterized protein n=1 Tax=Crucibulum laeve TaxID=68775 RepID=A0A5C3MAF7_9AGAR|nr:hypothetical protein BDQ12DRAFT_678031 [Crucibulum laeve]